MWRASWQLCCPHFFPYFSLQLFPYFSIYYSVQLAYIIWQIIIYMYRTRIMREFICFYLLSMYSILVKSIYNIQNSRPRNSAIHTIFWHPWLLHGLLLVLVSNIFLVLTFSYTILEQVNDVIGLQELFTMMPRFLADCCFSLVWGKPLLIWLILCPLACH